MAIAGGGSIRWIVSVSASAQVAEVRAIRGEQGYKADVLDLREMLSGYFDASEGCSTKLGKSICPIGKTSAGGKVLKTRWKYPNCGKRGGLRLCFVAFCERRTVVLCHATIRRDVDDDELIGSSAEADGYVDDDAE